MDLSSSLLPPSPRPVAARPLAISNLLLVVAALVFAMVVIGGITRLTESGLSITQWKPISGAIPPLSHADWSARLRPLQANAAISRSRRPGRNDARRASSSFSSGNGFTGCSAGSSAWSSSSASAGSRSSGQIPQGYGWRLAALFILGGLQGAVGWFMVHVGPRGPDRGQPLPPVRAFAVRAVPDGRADLDRARPARSPRPEARPARLTGWGAFALAVLSIQLMLGAWVAGFRAGYVSNSWPLT